MHIVKSNGNYRKKMTIAIAAGGTGGHIFPATSIAKLLIQEGFYVLFYTDKNFFKYVKNDDILFKSGMVKIIQLKSKNTYRLVQIAMIIRDFFSCWQILTKKVSVCVGFGGLVSFAPMLFSILTFKKTIIHEQNAFIGLANRLLLPFVTKCISSFEETNGIKKMFLKKCVFIGNPIREEIKKLVYDYDNPSVNYEAFYKIDDNINLSIIGGSQACNTFDNIIPEAISLLPDSILNKIHVFHQCKAANIERLNNFYTDNHISHDVCSFFYDIGQVLRKSHLVISRSGSTIISEILALGVPSILIPLPSAANNHQFYNAKFLRDHMATILFDQHDLKKETLSQLLLKLFNDDYALFCISSECRKLAIINADIKILNEIKSVIGIKEKSTINSDLDNIKYVNNNVGLG